MRRENALISNLPSVCGFVSVKGVPAIASWSCWSSQDHFNLEGATPRSGETVGSLAIAPASKCLI
jgi:hypothetical protein